MPRFEVTSEEPAPGLDHMESRVRPRLHNNRSARAPSPTRASDFLVSALTQPTGENSRIKVQNVGVDSTAYNLGNFLRRLALPSSVRHRSLTMLREKLIKIGAKVVRHSKYVIFQMAEVAVPHELFAAILERIQWYGVPPPLVRRG